MDFFVPKRDRHLFALYALALIVTKDDEMNAAFRRYATANVGLDDGDPLNDLRQALEFFHDEMHDIQAVAAANDRGY